MKEIPSWSACTWLLWCKIGKVEREEMEELRQKFREPREKRKKWEGIQKAGARGDCVFAESRNTELRMRVESWKYEVCEQQQVCKGSREKKTGLLRGISEDCELDLPPEKFLKRHSNDCNYFLIYVGAGTGHMEPLILDELHNLFQAFIKHLFCPKMQR